MSCTSLLILALAGAMPASARSYQPQRAGRSLASHTWYVRVGYESPHHAYQDMVFLPGTIWIDAGDAIVFWAGSAEIHTVTFLKPGQQFPNFDPTNSLYTKRQGSSSYTGRSYENSGILSNLPSKTGFTPSYRTYRLTFAVTGTFTYYCLVHGMTATIHVRRAGTGYPHSQAYYNGQITREGNAALDSARALTQRDLRQAGNRHVIVGDAVGMAMVMRFLPRTIFIHTGDTVTLVARAAGEPHTVSYGADPPNFGAQPIGDPRNFHGQQLNSGFLAGGGTAAAATYRVTFTRVGTYQFYCAVHDYMGMYLTVVVSGPRDRDGDGDGD
jgi:plastocyanin